MSEEEIIEKCQIFIDLYNTDSGDWDMQDTKEAMQSLLDLYNKRERELQQEKEKNKKLERDVQEMLRVIDTYEDDIAEMQSVARIWS